MLGYNNSDRCGELGIMCLKVLCYRSCLMSLSIDHSPLSLHCQEHSKTAKWCDGLEASWN